MGKHQTGPGEPGAARKPAAEDSLFAATELVAPPAWPHGWPAGAPSEPPVSALPSDFMVEEPTPSGISEPTLPDTAEHGTPATPARQPLQPPAQLHSRPTLSHVGRYALKALLGRGGLGQVHEAWDPLLSRTVAVKTLQLELPGSLRDAMDGVVLNEARAAAGLNHPYIVTVFDAGLSAHGLYIAMERLRGRDLRHALATGWLPSARVAAVLVRRVADALAYAHGRGVVHCDIKPGNIFLVGRDRPKVLDFGIARIAHGAALPALEGSVAGSPHYQAPEQLRGGPVDARTDVYALGVVMFELLTGRKAFAGNSLAAIQQAVLEQPPVQADQLRPGLPAELARIAAKAMAREPGQRYQSAAELAQALRRWSEAAQGPAGAGAGRSSRSSGRPRVAWLPLGLLLLGLLALAGLALSRGG